MSSNAEFNKADRQYRELDVLIIGGGIAGCAAALTILNNTGLSVGVVEKYNYEDFRVGEVLSPGAIPLLRYLDLEYLLEEDPHQPCYGTLSSWGSDILQEQYFLFSHQGTAWHLDRSAFDRSMADAVGQRGGIIYKNTRLQEFRRASKDKWLATISHSTVIGARYVIDATGKQASLARKLGAKKMVVDQLIGMVAVFASGGRAFKELFGQNTIIEAVKEGWWYALPGPSQSMIIALMTDAETARKNQWNKEKGAWLEAMMNTNHIRKLASNKSKFEIHTRSAQSFYLKPNQGKKWIAVGDAKCSYDPLSSLGITSALYTGIEGARKAVDVLTAKKTDVLMHADSPDMSFSRYLETRKKYYSLESRWPHADFWKRRQTMIALDPFERLFNSFPEDISKAEQHYLIYFSKNDRLIIRNICVKPIMAHQVIALFKLQSSKNRTDKYIILGVQELIQKGYLKVLAKESVRH